VAPRVEDQILDAEFAQSDAYEVELQVSEGASSRPRSLDLCRRSGQALIHVNHLRGSEENATLGCLHFRGCNCN
jgi:hypothetical protein